MLISINIGLLITLILCEDRSFAMVCEAIHETEGTGC